MLLYHGSNIQVSNPQIIESDRRLDFGKGFYLTSSYEQAKHWADLTVKRRGNGKRTSLYSSILRQRSFSFNKQ